MVYKKIEIKMEIKQMKKIMILLFLTTSFEARTEEVNNRIVCGSVSDQKEFFARGQTYQNTLSANENNYFRDIRKLLREKFSPKKAMVEMIKKNKLKPNLDKICTIVGISLDKSGKLTNSIIIQTSFYPKFDKMALKTIKAIGKYPIPPSELLNERDEILHMAWTFLVIFDEKIRL